MDAVRDAIANVLETWGPPALKALLTLVIGWMIARTLRGVLRRAMTRGRVDPTLTGFSVNLFYMALITLVVITAALGKLNVPTASFVAVIGAAGLAVGFALQGSLGNFAPGSC